MLAKPTLLLLRLLPLVIFLLGWQCYTNSSSRARFLYASPSLVWNSLVAHIGTGELIGHTLATGSEALVGFTLGVLVGSVIGFSLLFVPIITLIARPYVLALGAVPV